jgi:hypothetical protein
MLWIADAYDGSRRIRGSGLGQRDSTHHRTACRSSAGRLRRTRYPSVFELDSIGREGEWSWWLVHSRRDPVRARVVTKHQRYAHRVAPGEEMLPDRAMSPPKRRRGVNRGSRHRVGSDAECAETRVDIFENKCGLHSSVATTGVAMVSLPRETTAVFAARAL